jgi:hypothetical protein
MDKTDKADNNKKVHQPHDKAKREPQKDHQPHEQVKRERETQQDFFNNIKLNQSEGDEKW